MPLLKRLDNELVRAVPLRNLELIRNKRCRLHPGMLSPHNPSPEQPRDTMYRDIVNPAVAAMFRTARYVPYAWIFVVVFIAFILLLFIRVYGTGSRSRRRKNRL